MLSSYRVLDLTDLQGIFCGYILAQLGAEVIAIEPMSGSSVHQVPPFVGSSAGPSSDPGSEKQGDSLWWQAYSRGKQVLKLNLESNEGKRELLDLVKTADFLIESFSREDQTRLGLDYQSLSELNPALIVVSITPFGRTGPKADWPATDLTVWAASGAQHLAGDNDRAPVRTSVPQSFLHAGADAAGAALIALQDRHNSGLGQHIDVSAQHSSAQAALSANLNAHNNAGMTTQRYAGGLAAVFPIRMTWPCRDGFMAITFLFGQAFDKPNRRLLSWIQEHGACTMEDVQIDWGLRIAGMVAGTEAPDAYIELCDKIESFTLQYTKQELFEEGLKKGVYIAPTLDIPALLEEPQFQAREFWHQLEIEKGDGTGQTVSAPGMFAKFSQTPINPPGAPQAIKLTEIAHRNMSNVSSAGNQDDHEKAQISEPAATTSPSSLPLKGLKVLDFMWVIAGPVFTRVLADYGATVIKVESSKRMEAARAAPGFKNGLPGVESGIPFANFNAGKLGVTIDPANPVGLEVIHDLVRWADVVTESFSPKAMKAWGLDYASLTKINPNIIMLSSCLMGQTGPRALVPGYGNMAAAITGFYDLTGWSDRSPAGPYLAYTDGVAPRFLVASLLAALEHRRKTGEGQHIDLSQAEAAIHMLAPAILDHGLNAHTWHRMGNRDLQFSPHGVFPALGEDRWVAIVCQTDEAWRALCKTAGFATQGADTSLATAPGRLAREDELEALIADWTRTRDEIEIQTLLIDAEIAAHVVQNSPECLLDPQLQYRNHFITVPHTSEGDFVIESSRFKLSRTPASTLTASPEIGEHNVHVLMEILGYDGDRLADVFASLAME